MYLSVLCVCKCNSSHTQCPGRLQDASEYLELDVYVLGTKSRFSVRAISVLKISEPCLQPLFLVFLNQYLFYIVVLSNTVNEKSPFAYVCLRVTVFVRLTSLCRGQKTMFFRFLFLYMGAVPVCTTLPLEARREHQIPQDWSYRQL